MKIKTSELQGAALDWAVAKCEGYFSVAGQIPEYWESPEGAHHFLRMRKALGHGVHWAHISTDWAEGGPIIEREKIKVTPNMGGTWFAQIRHETDHPLVAHKVLAGWTNSHGPTPLIAAMRCYAASKLGDEIEIPKELK